MKRIARGVPPELRALWLDGTDGGEPGRSALRPSAPLDVRDRKSEGVSAKP